MLRDLTFKKVYRSEDDNLLEDFYIPALSQAVLYERAVGFFSASMLSYAAQGISALIQNNGKMRLVVGGEMSAEDVAAINDGYARRRIQKRLSDQILEAISSVSDDLFQSRIEALSWLVAQGRLDVKIALKQRGMYHEKIGILTDERGDRVIFQGSANETTQALLPDFNFESINVFCSWDAGMEDYYRPYEVGFQTLWDNQSKKTVVVDFPEAAQKQLIQIAKAVRSAPRKEIEIDIWRQLESQREEGRQATLPAASAPSVPTTLNGREFAPMDHQRAALAAWKRNDGNGILALATGAGKTITSIYGAVKVFETLRKICLIVSVPYTNLADQWVDELQIFNINALKCYGSYKSWEDRLSELLAAFQTGVTNFMCLVVVNRTMQGERFQDFLKQIDGKDLFWIGDECHHHGALSASDALPGQARFRMGLSATPEHYMNQEATERITGYYGPIVARYDLKDALNDGVLTPYKYQIELVEMTDGETDTYLELSEKISRLASRADDIERGSVENQTLKMLLFQRARLLGSAHNKLAALRRVLAGSKPSKHTLFYCGDGSTEDDEAEEPIRQIEAVSRVLGESGWRTSRFTSRESRDERKDILENFRLGLIDAMVAIRCLDEGIDVPACHSAYILASSRNPKQFIQRRGRILRRAPGKDHANVVDFVVKIPDDATTGSELERNLLKNELGRISEFASLSMNPGDVYETLSPYLDQYDLHHYFG